MKMGLKVAAAAGALVTALGLGYGVGVADQPHMANALNDLRSARGELDQAEHNKGGHREAAVGLIDRAIDEVKAGMADGR